MSRNDLLYRIEQNLDVMAGKPVIRGTRLPADYILRRVAGGSTMDELVAEYPGLSRDDIRACLLFSQLVGDQNYHDSMDALIVDLPAEIPKCIDVGKQLFLWCIVLLAIGRGTNEIFFRHRLGQGLDTWSLAALIPVWSMGIAGIILLFYGWLTYPTLYRRLESASIVGRDGKFFSRPTRWLITFTCGLFWFGMFLLVIDVEEMEPLWFKLVALYFTTTCCGVIIYLLNFYSIETHIATTTYLNLFGPFGVALAPLTWLPLLFLNWRTRQQQMPVRRTHA